MKTVKISVLVWVISCILLCSAGLHAQTIPEGIFSALKAGNSKELSKFFNANI